MSPVKRSMRVHGPLLDCVTMLLTDICYSLLAPYWHFDTILAYNWHTPVLPNSTLHSSALRYVATQPHTRKGTVVSIALYTADTSQELLGSWTCPNIFFKCRIKPSIHPSIRLHYCLYKAAASHIIPSKVLHALRHMLRFCAYKDVSLFSTETGYLYTLICMSRLEC